MAALRNTLSEGQGSRTRLKNLEPPPNSKRQKGDVKQLHIEDLQFLCDL